MVKKSIFVIAMMGMFASMAFAGDEAQNPWKFDDGWPHEVIVVWEELEICQIPVYIDVGYFVELKDCDKREINLVQVPCSEIGKDSGDFPCYSDCEDIEVRANFNVKLGSKLYDYGTGIIDGDKYDLYYQGDDVIPGDGAYHTATICLDLWSANIYNVPPKYDQAIGEVAITVKPNDQPNCTCDDC